MEFVITIALVLVLYLDRTKHFVVIKASATAMQATPASRVAPFQSSRLRLEPKKLGAGIRVWGRSLEQRTKRKCCSVRVWTRRKHVTVGCQAENTQAHQV